ncbi:MAG: lytic transglycosylase domain-containing protein [Candidatus Accumulibacter sp.]|nr:lytic transglycosylase domain-containing protein [Accumulibacter sp.]
MRRGVLLFFLLALGLVAAPLRAEHELEAPRVRAALEQGQMAEQGIGIRKNPLLAIALYCDAGTMGSPEGFFRVGRILASGPHGLRNPRLANAYLALAARLGNQQALQYYDPRVENAILGDECGVFAAEAARRGFDLEGYLARQSAAKQRLTRLIRNVAPQYKIDPRLALAIALTESNLDAAAVSPQNAQGVMQLIPATQQRFGVSRPFDPEQNIRGALAYLQWLHKRFAGDWRLMAAAYNAGEGSIERYGGMPPYRETQEYVRRVLHFAGASGSGREKSGWQSPRG